MTLEDLRTLCLSLPAATEDIKWGQDLVFSIGAKMFCATGLDQTPVSASFKVKDEDFDEFCSRPGFMPAPYLARYKWVAVDDITRLSRGEWEQCIRQSYELVKARLPAKVKKQLG